MEKLDLAVLSPEIAARRETNIPSLKRENFRLNQGFSCTRILISNTFNFVITPDVCAYKWPLDWGCKSALKPQLE